MANRNLVRPCIGRLISRPQAPSLLTFDGPLRLRQWPVIDPSPSTAKAGTAAPPASFFSTTPAQQKRRKTMRDNSRLRGVSPLRRTGLREPLSVSWDPLPRPALFEPEIDVDKDHGLYGFFRGRDKLMNTPQEDMEHGRAWTGEELRKKGWEDLQRLWWVCCRERNLISTANRERSRAKMGFGAKEASMRDEEVKKTMKAIKHILTERYYLWEDAVKLAQADPEIDLSGRSDAPFTPSGDIYEDGVEESPTSIAGNETEVVDRPAASSPATEPKLDQDGKEGVVTGSTEPKSKPDAERADAAERVSTPA